MLAVDTTRLATQSAPLDTSPYRVGLLAFIGNTPLVRLQRVTENLPADVEVWVKIEYFNPGGSVKDRAAFQMVAEGLASGRLTSGQTLVDSTSGNTGVAYAMIGAALGIDIELVMPSNVSPARKELATAYGAKLTYSDPLEGSDGAIRLVRRMLEEDVEGKCFYPDQYSNSANPRAHYLTTAPEIWKQTDGRVTHFVSGMGTTGTVMGTGARLRELNASVRVIGLEPADSFHGLEGLKHMDSSIVPAIFRRETLNRVLGVETEDAWDMQLALGRREGLAVGISGGAAVVGALQIAQGLVERREAGVIVALLPDSRERYVGERHG